METNNELFINGCYANAESYIRCAGIDAGDYNLKINSSCIRDFNEEISLKVKEEILKQINRVYIPEQEEDPKYTPNYRLGFL